MTSFFSVRIQGLLFLFLFMGLNTRLMSQVMVQDSLIQESREVFYRLLEEKEDSLGAVVDRVKENADFYDPPVIFVMSNRLYRSGERKEAVFWYYLARVRSSFSVNLATGDLRAFGEKKIELYTEFFGTAIEAYALSHASLLYPVLEEVLTYLENHEEYYNLLWPYTVGGELSSPREGPFLPRCEWKTERMKTLIDFKEKWQQLQRE